MRPAARVSAAIALAMISVQASPICLGQAQIRDFTRPFVVLDTGGHSAPVRSLTFEPEGTRLISSGMDKVIHTWDVGAGRATLSRTIRPAIWRGSAGIIYAVALSPNRDEKGQRLLAVGGYSAWSTQGNIGLFRYPGDPGATTGEVLAQLPSHVEGDPKSPGHSATVMDLAFSPDGRFLASCGNDGRVILWDVKARTPSASLSGPGKALNKLAFRPDGRRLAAGGTDGVLRLWDLDRRVLVAERGPTDRERPRPPLPPDPAGEAIVSLGFAPPRGDSLVIGRESGLLVRYLGDSLADPLILQKLGEVRGAVEALAFSHDGKTLAASVVSKKIERHSDRPPVGCEVQFRSLPDGALQSRKFEAGNLIHALAFSPDDRLLAYTGGDSQAVVIEDLTAAKRPGLRLEGQGSSVWQVGFGPDGRSLSFSHAQDRAGPAPEWIGFDLKGLALKSLEPAALSRSIATFRGWSVEPVDPLTLNLIGPDRKKTPIKLHPTRDHRWWGYSFLPPSATHPRPCLAVACEGGIAIYRLEDGVRTRTFAGHSSAVYDLAPSNDGMWLATGSSDQTVRLWSLAGCDTLPTLGATFRHAGNEPFTVATVARRGFAEGMGLEVGDTIEVLAVAGKLREPIADLEALDLIEPGLWVQFRVRRRGELVEVGTTRRDAPRLSLFVGEDREWVAWTPEGYYETSVAGDRKYLGWHRNGLTLDRPTDHFPAEKFEREFRKPAVLTTLIDTDDPARAFAQLANPNEVPAAIVQVQAPPVVKLSSPDPRAGDLVEAPPQGLNLRAEVAAEGRSPIASIRVLVDGRPTGQPVVFDPPRDEADLPINVPVHPGRQKVAVVAVNKAGKERMEAIEIVSAAPLAKPPTLHVLAIGASGPFLDPKFPEIPFADDDAKDLRAFLAAPAGRRRFDDLADTPSLLGRDVTGSGLREAIRSVRSEVREPNDMLVVVLESHVLTGAKDRFIMATDAGPDPTTADVPTAEELADALAEVASRGCKVLLLLDTSHEKAPAECRRGLTDWVRSLSRRNVIAFVAANHGASRRVVPKGHGAFAQGILDTFDARARSRPWVDPSRPMSLDDFQDAVVSRVKELTGRKQFAACYIPETLSPRVAIFEPNRPRSLADSK